MVLPYNLVDSAVQTILKTRQDRKNRRRQDFSCPKSMRPSASAMKKEEKEPSSSVETARPIQLRAGSTALPSRPAQLGLMTVAPSITSLRDFYAAESASIEAGVCATSDGRKAIQDRASLVDRIIVELSRDAILGPEIEASLPGGPRRLRAARAVSLFRYRSAVPVRGCRRARSAIAIPCAAISQTLWDLRLQLSPAYRTDRGVRHIQSRQSGVRHLVAGPALSGRRPAAFLRACTSKALPRLLARCGSDLLRDISELTRQRHAKEGDTIFHLEPNLKNSPGGLRDYHMACWVAHALASAPHRRLGHAGKSLAAATARRRCARPSIFSPRRAAFCITSRGATTTASPTNCRPRPPARGIGVEAGRAVEPADWMRIYFRHARAVYGLSTQLLDEALPAPTTLLRPLREVARRAARNPETSVAGGRLVIHRLELVRDLDRLLGLFLVHRPGRIEAQPRSRGTDQPGAAGNRRAGRARSRPVGAVARRFWWRRTRPRRCAPCTARDCWCACFPNLRRSIRW